MSNISNDSESLSASGVYDGDLLLSIDPDNFDQERRNTQWLLVLGAAALAFVYFGLAILHVIVLSGTMRLTMVAMSVCSSVIGAWLWFRWREKAPGSDRAVSWLAFLLAIPSLNSLVHLLLSAEIKHSTNMMLIVVATGYVFQRVRVFWTAVAIEISVTLAVIFVIGPNADTNHFLVMLVLSVVLSSLIRRARLHHRSVEERLSLAIGSADLGYFDWHLPNGELLWDDKMHQLFNLPTDSRVNRHDHFLKAIHPDDRDRVAAEFAQALDPNNKHSVFRSVFRIGHPKSVPKYIVSHALHFKKTDGQVARLIGTCRDISAEKEGRQTLKDARARAVKQQAAFAKIAVERNTSGNLDAELRRIAEIASETLNVERTGIWLLSDDQKKLSCLEQFLLSKKEHSNGCVLNSGDYPGYWKALRSDSRINAHDALQDSRVAEFRIEYLIPLGITSMLDAVFTLDDKLAGVVCFEHTGTKREWHPDEEAFATSIASIVSQLLVTDQRRQMEREHRRLIDYVSAGVVVHAPDTSIISCNWMATQILKLSESQLLGLEADGPQWKFVRDDGSPMPAEEFPVNRVIATHEGVGDYIVGVEFADEGTTWCLARAYPVFANNGSLREIVVTFIDITRQRTAMAGLRESELHNRLLIENAPCCIHEIDMEGRFISVNTAGLKMMELGSAEEIIGRKYLGLVSQDHRARIQSLMDAAFTGKSSEFEFRATNDRAYTSSFVPIYDEDRLKVIRLMGMSVDITDRLQASQEREQLQLQLSHALKLEAVGQLAGGVAHDFNNLLHIMKVYGEFAQEDAEQGSEQLRYLQETEKAVERATSLVSQLLAFSRRQNLQQEDVDLNVIVEEAVEMLRRAIGSHINIEFFPSEDNAVVHVDLGQMNQVLINLCTNARDAMPDGGTITINLQVVNSDDAPDWVENSPSSGKHVILTIADNGVGMSSSTLDHIFEPFFTTKEVGKGTGLGLSTVYGLVQQHGGAIYVDSQLNKGSLFLIALPVVPGTATARIGIKAEARITGSETILLVEDEEAIRETNKRVLSLAGYQVHTANNGEQAMATFFEHSDKIDLVLLDVIMPELSGRTVYERLKKLRPNLPVLFVSGYSDASVETDFISDRKLPLLHKPFSREELLLNVRQELDRAANSTTANVTTAEQ